MEDDEDLRGDLEGPVHRSLDESPDGLETLIEQHKSAVERFDLLGWPRPEVAVVSGSGLGVDLGERTRGPVQLEFLLPFPVHAVEGHQHAVEMFEPLPGRHVLYYRGRLHSYQGYSANDTVFQIRLAALLGAKVLVMTNATGGLQPLHRAGDLVLIRDHVNLTGLNPLRGQLPPDWGPRFPDMTAAYDPRLRALALRLASELGVPLSEGVYMGLAGPSYETPAEVRMLQTLGGDVAGMSTVLEVIAAHSMGVRCLCISMVSNPGAGLSADPVKHEDVLAAGQAAAAKLRLLLGELLRHPELV
ncbi:MAG TPA: purine-nucleoside phosphorylase [Thermoanaerobaculia bacterium]|jgi:purine-nucleoside phosphorylase|nr:purine-nucleoside phosphorylase [Thermoanaerobaculia bacterium]